MLTEVTVIERETDKNRKDMGIVGCNLKDESKKGGLESGECKENRGITNGKGQRRRR